MTRYRVGDVVSIEFPFSDLQERKRRPGLVLAADDKDVLVARVTSHAPRDTSDVALKHWAASRSNQASTVRLTKLAAVDGRLVHHQIGHLQPEGSEAVAQVWQQVAAAISTELRKA